MAAQGAAADARSLTSRLSRNYNKIDNNAVIDLVV
jgi:hypothetical protein